MSAAIAGAGEALPARTDRPPMRLAVGALQYFWPREQVVDFYRNLASRPPLTIYLGETVCSKRRELGREDWLEIARMLGGHGHEVVISTLALIEAASELGACRRWVENGEFRIEANDYSAVQFLVERELPFVAGPGLNVYNHLALRRLQKLGMQRLVLPVEFGRERIGTLVANTTDQARTAGIEPPEFEVLAWGRVPLAWSARCFTARLHGRGKDQCGFECIHHPEGQEVSTRDGRPYLNLNGVQVQSAAIQDLSGRMKELRHAGVDLLRLYPAASGFDQVLDRFDAALAGQPVKPMQESLTGYWDGTAGMNPALALRAASGQTDRHD
ncbi:MAG: U32 family peptidase [Wenzhouxiangellaceae bacterium]